MVDIKSEPASTELQERMESNKQELDRYLGVYPHDRFLMCYASFTYYHYGSVTDQLQCPFPWPWPHPLCHTL